MTFEDDIRRAGGSVAEYNKLKATKAKQEGEEKNKQTLGKTAEPVKLLGDGDTSESRPSDDE